MSKTKTSSFKSFKIMLFTFFVFVYGMSASAQWTIKNLPDQVSVRSAGISPSGHIWLGSNKGGIWVSKNQGQNWINMCPKLFNTFDFRGIAVISDNEIIAMSSGEAEKGSAFLIKSNDGGQNWDVVFRYETKGAFFDCIKFEDNKIGYLLSDTIDDKPLIFKTEDGGKTWGRLIDLPNIIEGEASFAASNSSITVFKKKIWFVTQSRVFYSKNRGRKFKVLNTPFEKGTTSGIFGIFALSCKYLWICGGDYQNQKNSNIQMAFSKNSGIKWHNKPYYYMPGLTETILKLNRYKLIALGTNGTHLIDLKSKTLVKLDQQQFHVAIKNKNTVFASGPNGRVGILKIEKNKPWNQKEITN